MYEVFENILKANDSLFQIEYQLILDNHGIEVEKVFETICYSNSKNIVIIDKIINKNVKEITNKQIISKDITKLNNLKKDLESYKNHGLKIQHDEKIICWKLKFDFEKLKIKNITYYLKIQLVELK